MNPFEETQENTIKKDFNIDLWLEVQGRKKSTYISGWDIELKDLTKHLKIIKKKKGCNGTIKDILNENNDKIQVILLQGDHLTYITEYLSEIINPEFIHIKGITK